VAEPARSARATGRVTLADVARLCGVSTITASRVLNGSRPVAPELAERVRDAAKRLGYVADPAAQALASRTSSHVAVLVPLLTNALFVELLEGVMQVLHPAGCQTLIGITHYDASEEAQLLREQLLHRPAGILVTGFDRPAPTTRLLADSRVPCVHLMELPPAGAHGTHGAPNATYAVGLSQQAAGAAMTRHLLERGRRRIAFAAAQLDPRTMQRLAGWREALRAAGRHDARLEWLNPAPSSLALGAAMFEQILAQRPAVDAIFFCNDDLAQGALLAAMRLGVTVPQKLAIAGFNDLPGSDQCWPPLTSIRTPRAAIGAEAARMVLELARGQTPRRPVVDLGFELVVRGST
jgi:LacI family gluconate utilization system Gnt-I transcriptional repressor